MLFSVWCNVHGNPTCIAVVPFYYYIPQSQDHIIIAKSYHCGEIFNVQNMITPLNTKHFLHVYYKSYLKNAM